MKMKFNTIIISIILFFLNTSLCFLRHSSPDATFIGSSGIRFTQKELLKKNSELEKKFRIKEKNDNSANIKYDVEIIVVKEDDPNDAEPVVMKNYINLSEKNIDLLTKDTHKIEKSINWVE